MLPTTDLRVMTFVGVLLTSVFDRLSRQLAPGMDSHPPLHLGILMHFWIIFAHLGIITSLLLILAHLWSPLGGRHEPSGVE